MKRRILTILLLAAVGGLLAGCASGRAGLAAGAPPDGPSVEDGPGDGYATGGGNPDAPKTIESTEIIGFSCRFSLADDAEPGALGNGVYTLTAKEQNGSLTGELAVDDRGGRASRTLAAESRAFLDELQVLVEMYGLAQFNGYSYQAAGLPDGYGAELDVAYASGESIYAVDNQSCFLPYAAMSELVKLFERGTATMPERLSFSVTQEFQPEEKGGGWIYLSYPVYTLGERTSDGDSVSPEGCEQLSAALAQLNARNENEAKRAAEGFGSLAAGEMASVYIETVVTRADSEALSFYERVVRQENGEPETVLIRTYNLDARTGRELTFSDVFSDMQYLPNLLEMEFERAYPEETFRGDALETVRRSVESGDGGICFALGYGGVHIFADEFVLNRKPGVRQFTLSYVLHPYQVRAYYTTEPERFLIPLDYDVTYWRSDISVGFRMSCRGDEASEGESVLWTVAMDGADAAPWEESFYGYAPECWLARVNGRDFLYLRLPVGDVSMYTKVYEIAEQGVTCLTEEPLELAVESNTPLDPDRMRMSLNEYVFTMSVQMLPSAAFRVGGDGLPEMAGTVYDLNGPWAQLREGGRYNPDSRENAAVSGGMWTLAPGQRMRPYRTDMRTFLDFITDDGRVVRFGIDRFDYTMQLDNFGTLDDVFVPEGVG